MDPEAPRVVEEYCQGVEARDEVDSSEGGGGGPVLRKQQSLPHPAGAAIDAAENRSEVNLCHFRDQDLTNVLTRDGEQQKREKRLGVHAGN